MKKIISIICLCTSMNVSAIELSECLTIFYRGSSYDQFEGSIENDDGESIKIMITMNGETYKAFKDLKGYKSRISHSKDKKNISVTECVYDEDSCVNLKNKMVALFKKIEVDDANHEVKYCGIKLLDYSYPKNLSH